MPSAVIKECPCCNEANMKENNGWHCEWCWNKYHHGKRDKDFLTREQYDKETAT